jgi:hypothetical protein
MNQSQFPIHLDLSAVELHLHGQARQAFLGGDVKRFVSTASNTRAWDLVRANRGALWVRGLYERAIIEALVIGRANNAPDFEREIGAVLRRMLRGESSKRLRAAYPLPGTGPWELYRGVSGRAGGRWARGVLWMRDRERARGFAEHSGLEEPAVFRAVVPDRYVLAYVKGGEEELFVALIPNRLKIERVWSCHTGTRSAPDPGRIQPGASTTPGPRYDPEPPGPAPRVRAPRLANP